MSWSGNELGNLKSSLANREASSNLESRPKSAKPALILRGARLVECTTHSNTKNSWRNKPPHSPHRAVDQIFETSPPICNELPRRTPAFDPQVGPGQLAEREYLQAGIEIEALSVAEGSALDGLHLLPELRSCRTKTRMTNESHHPNADSQMPLVVNRVIPEYSGPFRKRSNRDLRLYEDPRRDEFQNSKKISKDGNVGISRSTEMISSEHAVPNLCSSRDAGAAQRLQRTRTIRMLRADTAITLPVSSEQDIADAVERQDLRLRDGQFTGSRNRLDTTNSASSTHLHTALGDGLQTPLGCQSTLPPLPRPPLHPSTRPPLLVRTSESAITTLRSNQRLTDSIPKPSPCQRTGPLLPQSQLVKLDRCQITPPGPTTIPATSEMLSKSDGQGESGTVRAIASDKDEDETSPISPWSDSSSEYDSYETPMTSPSASPTKLRPSICQFPIFASIHIAQLDGKDGSDDKGRAVQDECGLDAAPTPVQTQDAEAESGNISEDGRDEGIARSVSSLRRTLSSCEDYHHGFSSQGQDQQDEDLEQEDNHDGTPLGPASPAKGSSTFSFPCPSGDVMQKSRFSQLRYPSALLMHCDRNATPRQRRLMTGGMQAPDRFIPARSGTPTKETLLFPKPRPKPTVFGGNHQASDPFGPVPRRSLRMAEQHATVRHPPTTPRAVGSVSTRVQDAQSPSGRTASAGTVWSVGGSIVTEGVLSVMNGRGGRVTSGSTAHHYTADFLRRNTPSEEEVTHGRRLALAMDLGQNTRMIEHSSPASSTSLQTPSSAEIQFDRKWRDGVWEQPDVVSPTKVKTAETKDVPVIPFRVLDAPALRDDYYCSLLAYSPTVQCLAVGLGPHVYLWSENRGSTSIPDSLTAPLGSSHVTSISFSSSEGRCAILAIGRADGRITLWSPLDPDPRFDSEQPSPISCVCFRPTTVRRQSLRDPIATAATEELLVGDEVGHIYYYSIEWPSQEQRDLFDWHGSMTLLARICCHSQQVCGLAWSPDSEFFATGGNDNQLFLFESKKVLKPSTDHNASSSSAVHVRNGSSGSSNATVAGQGEVLEIAPGQEKHVFTLNAAVKAIAFAPWQSTLVAAGGGSNDRCVHFFHSLSGASLATIDCHAQVTSLVWSEKRKEIATTFGFAQPEHPYRVAVFTWPSCNMVVKIPWWSEERALYAVAYPRGPSSAHHRNSTRTNRTRRGGVTSGTRLDAEGRPWYGKRTREEGCLVVATSDASIKFHEIWAEHSVGAGKRVAGGILGSSQILEEESSGDIERWSAIR